MEAEDFKVGDKVTVEDGGQELHGVVESVQLKAELVDVKIYEPGHRSHCLIKAYPADAVSMDEKKKEMNEQKENPPELKEEPEVIPGKEPEVFPEPVPVQEPAPAEDEPEPEAAGDDAAQSA